MHWGLGNDQSDSRANPAIQIQAIMLLGWIELRRVSAASSPRPKLGNYTRKLAKWRNRPGNGWRN